MQQLREVTPMHPGNIDKLAIFSGNPSFEETLHVGKPNIGDRDRLLARIENMLTTGRLSNEGPMVKEFEKELARELGVKHCIAVCNGTIALQIAIRALNLVGEVILPSYTFIATAHALQWQRINPVFCDVDPTTHLLDPARVEELITPRTSAIMGVHLWGQPCAVDELTDIAKRHKLTLLYDAAHAYGVSHRGQMIGGFGEAEVFSFHATKVLNSFEGGAITTNNDALAQQIRLMCNFGFPGGKYDFVTTIGTNGKMNEACAAMGLTSLENVQDFVAANRINYEIYKQELGTLPGVKVLKYDDSERHNYHYVVVELDTDRFGIGRDQVVDVLHAENVLARRYFWPGCHRMEPYRTLQPHVGRHLPNTERIAERVVVLPTGNTVSANDVRNICRLLRTTLTNGAEITRRLTHQTAQLPIEDVARPVLSHDYLS